LVGHIRRQTIHDVDARSADGSGVAVLDGIDQCVARQDLRVPVALRHPQVREGYVQDRVDVSDFAIRGVHLQRRRADMSIVGQLGAVSQRTRNRDRHRAACALTRRQVCQRPAVGWITACRCPAGGAHVREVSAERILQGHAGSRGGAIVLDHQRVDEGGPRSDGSQSIALGDGQVRGHNVIILHLAAGHKTGGRDGSGTGIGTIALAEAEAEVSARRPNCPRRHRDIDRLRPCTYQHVLDDMFRDSGGAIVAAGRIGEVAVGCGRNGAAVVGEVHPGVQTAVAAGNRYLNLACAAALPGGLGAANDDAVLVVMIGQVVAISAS